MKKQQPTAQMMELSPDVLKRKLAQKANNPGRAAVFIDRDGTINIDRGYLCNPDEVALLPTAGEALRLLNKLDLPVVVITNQSALGRGLMELGRLEAVNTALWQALRPAQAYYEALYYCPHNPDQGPCACRKPQAGLLLQAALDLDLDLKRCFMVGDKRSDLEAGYACGCRTILVRTGWGEGTYRELASQKDKPDYVASTLLKASQWIASQPDIAALVS